jgi:hypothetical protein
MILDETIEKWIPNFEGQYSITINGEVLSYKTGVPKPLKLIHHKSNKKTRVLIYLYPAKSKTKGFIFSVPRLVYTAFSGLPIDKYDQIINIDNNFLNCKFDNLMLHRKYPNLKQTKITVIDEGVHTKYSSVVEIMALYGISYQTAMLSLIKGIELTVIKKINL